MIKAAVRIYLLFAFATVELLAGSSHRSAFSYSKEVGLGSQIRAVKDLILYKDGTLHQGDISGVCRLTSALGEFSFPVDQLECLFSVKGEEGVFKLRTRKNEVYVGTLENRSLIFSSDFDLKSIDAVLLRPRDLDLNLDKVMTVSFPQSSIVAVGEDFDLNAMEGEIEEDLDENSRGDDLDVEFISRQEVGGLQVIAFADGLKQKASCDRPCRPTCNPPILNPPPPVVFPEEDPDEVIAPFDSAGCEVSVAPCFAEHENRQLPPPVYEDLIYISASGSGFYLKPEKVSNYEYKQFVDAINYPLPGYWIGGEIPAGLENEPVVGVTYRDAFLYSVWAGKRLPTEKELQIAVEAEVILQGEDRSQAEWTATPTLYLVQHRQGDNSVKMGGSFPPAHQVFSLCQTMSMNNKEMNPFTGFRTALSAY